ncbi:MAG: B12-binding domain-containing protein, partial [Armatimonadetes bacterium]|nr:B12-binding domain-containing protein [Armatimonadota bacterium]
MADLQALAEAVINGDRDEVARLAQEAVDEGVDPESIVNDGLIVGMDEVGRRFKANEFYVPEVLIAARAMHGGMDIVKPLLAERGIEPRGQVLIGTTQGDLHDIGKNLVAMMLEGGGYEVVDIGVDVSPDQFVEAISEHSPNVVAMSALLTTTMPAM